MHRLKFSLLVTGLIVICGARIAIGSGDDADVFGRAEGSEAALVGMLYDLKQTQDHQPTGVTPDSYSGIIDEFLSSGWDESVLNRYYRVSKPLYTTQIFIPTMNADYGPSAFGAGQMVKPSRWVIHYKGQVSSPESGTYRFWGIADDVMAVAVNGKTVLVGKRADMQMPKTKWRASEPNGAHAGNGDLRPGDWMTLAAGQIIDLDVIIGERPGGFFNAFVMLQKQGVTYATDRRGCLILPIFQVAPYATPETYDAQFATGAPVWKSYQ